MILTELQGGSIGAIHEDRTGALWLGLGTGLYRFDPKTEVFTRYTQQHGLPSDDVMGILEDDAGKLWISSKKGLSRFDSQTKTFRNYDVSDGLRSNDFSRSCYQRRRSGEMFFCGSEGVTAFFPEDIRDNPVRAASRAHELQNLQRPRSDWRRVRARRRPSRMPSR